MYMYMYNALITNLRVAGNTAGLLDFSVMIRYLPHIEEIFWWIFNLVIVKEHHQAKNFPARVAVDKKIR